MNKIKLTLLSILSVFLLDATFGMAVAQPIGGAYTTVGRSNDPFVFCTQGVPQHRWRPVNPLAGTWRCLGRCKYVNKYWIPTYQSICPKALKMGGWTGPGSGDQFKADAPSGELRSSPH